MIMPTTVADAVAQAGGIIAACQQAGAASGLLACIAETATYDPSTHQVRTYGPLNAALAWKYNTGSGWCRSAEDWERDGRSVERKEMAVPVLVKGAEEGMVLLRRYPYEATEGAAAVTEPVNGRSCDRLLVEDALEACKGGGLVDAQGMVEAYFGIGKVRATNAEKLSQAELQSAIAQFKSSAAKVHLAYEGRGGAYRPRRIEAATALPVAAEMLAPAEVTEGTEMVSVGWDDYAARVKPLISLLADSWAKGRYDAERALKCFSAVAAEIGGSSGEDGRDLMRTYLPELAEDCQVEAEIARAMEGLR